jgi:antitoxin component HigA of HigAB toxin-antitoxin module
MRNCSDLLTFDFGTAPVDTMPATPTDDFEAARLAHGKAEAAEVRARAAYDSAMAANIKVIRVPVDGAPEAVQAIRAAGERARADLAAAFGNYAASARALSRARALARS